MEKIIKESLKEKGERTKKIKDTEKNKEIQSLLSSHKTRIKVVGCGGAGNNTITRMVEIGVPGVQSITINTDAQDLLYADADEKILIGKEITNGLGAGSDPEIGERSARETEAEITALLENTDLVFVTCGLGGGTGTGSAPIVAEIARNLGALTISVVTVPFTDEGIMRYENAMQGLEKLEKNSDTVIVVQNDKLIEIVPDMPLNQAFKVSDEILVNAVKGITELVTEKGLVNLDFADIRAVMRDGGTAMIGLGESNGDEKALEAVEMAVQNPLLDVEIVGAKSALINITGGNDMSLKDARQIMQAVAERLDPAARVIWGARMDPDLENTLRVMLIVTGLKSNQSGKRTYVASVKKDSSVKPVITPEVQPKSNNEALDSSEEKNMDPLENFDLIPGDTLDTGVVLKKQVNLEKNVNTKLGEALDEDLDDEFGVELPGTELDEDLGENFVAEINEKSVFNRIFEEETEADLTIFENAVMKLEKGEERATAQSEIRNAASSLANSAQLFAFNHIASFAESIEGLTLNLEAGKLTLDEQVITLFQDAVAITRGMIYNEQEAVNDSFHVIEQISEKIESASGNSGSDATDASVDTDEESGDDSKKKIKI
ncbi:MAG: cell division protein FtsZ [Calditrichaeota bacterium]|nr:MAG: cell division protein FtsZ [Calditrichota bacterium]